MSIKFRVNGLLHIRELDHFAYLSREIDRLRPQRSGVLVKRLASRQACTYSMRGSCAGHTRSPAGRSPVFSGESGRTRTTRGISG